MATIRNQSESTTPVAMPPAMARSTKPELTAARSMIGSCLSHRLYAVVMTTYNPTTRANRYPASNQASANDTARSTEPTPMANWGATTPEATGRYRLVGWRRSRSASMVSLRKYVPEAAIQKIPKAPSALSRASPWVRTPAAPGATKTSKFLIHWRGRAMRTIPRAMAWDSVLPR